IKSAAVDAIRGRRPKSSNPPRRGGANPIHDLKRCSCDCPCISSPAISSKLATGVEWNEQHEPVGPARTRRFGGVTVSTGSIAAKETCRGVGTRNRLQLSLIH